MLIDTHTHLFLHEFDTDRKEVVDRAIQGGIKTLILPNVDSETLPALIKMTKDYPQNCFPLYGLHPGSVNENYRAELEIVRNLIDSEKCLGIGEIGLDFYWDKTFKEQQIEAFDTQLKWAAEKRLPVVIHLRESYGEVIKQVKINLHLGLKGIFHCFTGSIDQAKEITDMGFYLGIGGIVTFKNGGLAETLSKGDIRHLVLETDSPYLAPVPFRGKRNESSYLLYVCMKLAEIYQLSEQEVMEITTANAQSVFNL